MQKQTVAIILLLCMTMAGCAAAAPLPTSVISHEPVVTGAATPTMAVTPAPAPTASEQPVIIQPEEYGGTGDYLLMGNTWVYYDYVNDSLCAIELDAPEDAAPRRLKNGSNWFLPWGEDVLYFGSYAQTSRGFISNPQTGESLMIDKKHAEFYVPFYTAGEYVYFSRNGEAHLETEILRMHKETQEIEQLYSLYGSIVGVGGDQIIMTDLQTAWAYDFSTGKNQRTLFVMPEGTYTSTSIYILNDMLAVSLAYYEGEFALDNITHGELLLIGLDGTVRIAIDQFVELIRFTPTTLLARSFTDEYDPEWMTNPDYLLTKDGLYHVSGLELSMRPMSFNYGAVVFPGLVTSDLLPIQSMQVYSGDC